MTSKRSKQHGTGDALRLYGWDDGKVYFWSPQTGEKCVSDEAVLVQKLIAVCAESFQEAPERKAP